MPLCHYATTPLGHYATMPLCNYATVPLCHYAPPDAPRDLGRGIVIHDARHSAHDASGWVYHYIAYTKKTKVILSSDLLSAKSATMTLTSPTHKPTFYIEPNIAG